MARTPVSRLKASVSCESMAVPDGQPTIDRRAMISVRAAHFERLGSSAKDDEPPVDAETAHDRAHGFAVGHGRDDDPGAAQLGQFGRGVLRLTVEVVPRASCGPDGSLSLPRAMPTV